MMRLEIAVDAQRESMRRNLARQAVVDGQADILVDRRHRHGGNTVVDVGVRFALANNVRELPRPPRR